ncbi:hypothetical protein QVD17_30753 [Tagetes erecta]|uniref:Uncharacterized protein n=1 Tax=Tagetes erecta TaxID=13708 RepID=A0AAD8K674_TARER|nr:hypothetical protein QVD17_30753 [Tagetes erecta]
MDELIKALQQPPKYDILVELKGVPFRATTESQQLAILGFAMTIGGELLPMLSGKTCDLNWDSEYLPSLPFQALFRKLQQLAMVAGDVLRGKENIQKVLFARLTETVVMCLMSNEEDFWCVLKNQTSPQLQLQGLEQGLFGSAEWLSAELLRASFSQLPSQPPSTFNQPCQKLG